MESEIKKTKKTNFFSIMDYKTMMHLNTVAIIITTICEIFAISMFLVKNQSPNLAHWKYVALIIGLVIVSFLFLGSIASMILFFRMRKKQNSSSKS